MWDVESGSLREARAASRAAASATFARFCAYAFMLSMPWAAIFAERLNPHDVARMLESAVLLVAAWAWVQLPTSLHGGPLWERSGRTAIAGLALASTLAAPRLVYAALELSALALLFLLVLVFARTPATVLRRELPPVLSLAGLIAFVMELPRWAFFLSDGRLPNAMDFGFMYMNPRFFNHVQSVMLPLTLVPLLVPAPRWARAAAWVALCGGLALLWHTGGRATLIAVGVFTLVVPCLLGDRRSLVLRVLLLAALGAAAVYALLILLPAWVLAVPAPQHDTAGARLAQFHDSGRFYLWERAAQGVLQHPWLGLGPMHFAQGGNLVAAHPHNSVLQLAAEWGLPATVLLLAALAVAALRTLHGLASPSFDPDVRAVLAIAALSALAGCLDSLASGTLVMPVSQLWWGVALGVALSAQPRRSTPTGTAAARWRLPLVVGLALLHIGLSALAYQRALEPAADSAGLHRNNVPRYWINGFF